MLEEDTAVAAVVITGRFFAAMSKDIRRSADRTLQSHRSIVRRHVPIRYGFAAAFEQIQLALSSAAAISDPTPAAANS
jgi:hypothetical protein